MNRLVSFWVVLKVAVDSLDILGVHQIVRAKIFSFLSLIRFDLRKDSLLELFRCESVLPFDHLIMPLLKFFRDR